MKEDTPNSLGKYRFSANETMIIGNNIADEIVQGEDSETKNILLDDSCEELVLPHYFSVENLGIFMIEISK